MRCKLLLHTWVEWSFVSCTKCINFPSLCGKTTKNRHTVLGECITVLPFCNSRDYLLVTTQGKATVTHSVFSYKCGATVKCYSSSSKEWPQSRGWLFCRFLVHGGSFHVSIIHWTLTWTAGSLTCVCDHSYAWLQMYSAHTSVLTSRHCVQFSAFLGKIVSLSFLLCIVLSQIMQ